MAEDVEDFYNAKTRAMKRGKQARLALAILNHSNHSQFPFLTLPRYPVVRLARLGLSKHKSH